MEKTAGESTYNIKIDIKVLNSCQQKGKGSLPWIYGLKYNHTFGQYPFNWTIKCPFVIPCSWGFRGHIDKFIESVKK